MKPSVNFRLVPVNHPNMTPLQNGLSQSTLNSTTSLYNASQNSSNGCISTNMYSQEHNGPLPSSKSLPKTSNKQDNKQDE